MYLGAILMLMELMAPGFVIFFFGLSASTVGLCRFAFGEAFDLTWQLASFSAFSILYLVFLRSRVRKVFAGKVETADSNFENEDAGRLGKVTVAIDPPLTGRVMVGDAEWTAEADSAIAAGTDVRVVSRHNLTMKVEKI
jgi:membrane protein implicated in regulation of membrane protease activity